MAAAGAHSHRAGKLKQQNKKNKRSSASKRSLNRKAGGKVQSVSLLGGNKRKKSSGEDAANAASSSRAKANRTNEAKQRREASKLRLLNSRRGILSTSSLAAFSGDYSVDRQTLEAMVAPPPRVVGIISLSENEEQLEEKVRDILTRVADRVVIAQSDRDGMIQETGHGKTVTVSYAAHQKSSPTSGYLTLLTNTTSFRAQYTQHTNQYTEEDASIHSALDLCRVCDLVLFLIDGSSITSWNSLSGNSVTDGESFARDVNSGCNARSGRSDVSIAPSVKTSADTSHFDHVVSERGDRILSALKAQGLPSPMVVIVHENGESTLEQSMRSGISAPMVVGFAQPGGDEDMDDGHEDDYGCSMSLDHLVSHCTQKSSKSIRRTYLRRRVEFKRYVSRLACTEFGDNCRVAEIELTDDGVFSMKGPLSEDGVTVKSVAESAPQINFAMSSSSKTIDASSRLTTNKSQQTSISALIRTLCTISVSGPAWVADAPRPYLVTDGTAKSSSTVFGNIPAVEYDATNEELKLTGYIRGNNAPWNVNHLAHIPHLGTFAVKSVALAKIGNGTLPPIIAVGRKGRAEKKGANVEMEDNSSTTNEFVVLAESDPDKIESLEMFASPDALEGEQNLIGFDEDEEQNNDLNCNDPYDPNNPTNVVGNTSKNFQPGTARPAGWSDYQSAWLDAIGDTDDLEDHGELAYALNKKKDDLTTVEGYDISMEDGDEVNAADRCALLAQRKKDYKDELEFPDEVAAEEVGLARERYARYRSLKSFRKSHWDPRENLPETYGAIYHFANFKSTQKDVFNDMKSMCDIVKRRRYGCGLISEEEKSDNDQNMDDNYEDEEEAAIARACVLSGAYVTITLIGVSSSDFSRISAHTILTAVSILPHENKASVIHMGLSQTSRKDVDDEIPIKSKDVFTFRCGWKTWHGRPIFSQNNLNSDKHKFERFMPTDGAFFACTVLGPVTYAPCPVLLFRDVAEAGEGNKKRKELVAHGSVIGADADRIVLKRIILTGYPTRVHKRHATVKYMFYNPEDVKWFQPAGLTTKQGLQGNIIDSIGDHGVMKCLFNAPIKQHDTVCLPLYKRVFPKFAPIRQQNNMDDDKRSSSMLNKLLVL